MIPDDETFFTFEILSLMMAWVSIKLFVERNMAVQILRYASDHQAWQETKQTFLDWNTHCCVRWRKANPVSYDQTSQWIHKHSKKTALFLPLWCNLYRNSWVKSRTFQLSSSHTDWHIELCFRSSIPEPIFHVWPNMENGSRYENVVRAPSFPGSSGAPGWRPKYPWRFHIVLSIYYGQ